MRRDIIIKTLFSFFKSNDFVVIAGQDLCGEVSSIAENQNFLMLNDDTAHASALALGVALGTPKRVFFVCEDYYALRNMHSLANIAASKCSNIFVFILSSKVYPRMAQCPTIGDSLMSLKGIFFNMGFKAYGYTNHFTTVPDTKKTMAGIFKFLKGPTVAIIELAPRNKESKFKHSSVQKCRDLVMSELGTSLFNPPINFNSI